LKMVQHWQQSFAAMAQAGATATRNRIGGTHPGTARHSASDEGRMFAENPS